MPVIEQEPIIRKTPPPQAGRLSALKEEPLGATTKRPLFHRPGVVVVAAIVAIIAIGYIATIFFHSLTHESTDDAFIDAHIVSIAPKISGKISAVRVQDNQLVKKGDPLLELDPRDIEATVAQRRAALDVAKAHLENARMGAEQADAHVRTLQAAYEAAGSGAAATAADAAKVRADLERNRGLIASGAISTQDFQHSQSDAISSEATLDSKRNSFKPQPPLQKKEKNKPARPMRKKARQRLRSRKRSRNCSRPSCKSPTRGSARRRADA